MVQHISELQSYLVMRSVFFSNETYRKVALTMISIYMILFYSGFNLDKRQVSLYLIEIYYNLCKINFHVGKVFLFIKYTFGLRRVDLFSNQNLISIFFTYTCSILYNCFLSECGETCSLFFVLCCMFLSDFICFDGVFGVLFIYCFVWLLCFDVFVVKCVGDDAPIVVNCVRYKYIMLCLLLRLC